MATQTLNASTPGLVGWTAGPETRGTLTLVWSCVITIFACTWTVLHLNVPGRTEGAMAITLRKMKWMAINVLFPEFIFAKAVCDLRLALEELREFDVNVTQKKTRLQLCEWTVSYKGVSHEWSWEFEYPLWARGLYGLLGLTPPEPPFNEKPLPQWISRIFSLISSNAKSPENSNDPEAQHSNGQKDPHANRATSSYNQQEIAKVSKDPDALSSRTQEVRLSQTPQKASRAKLRTVQKWTVVHSYYAQMGGLLYQSRSSNPSPLYHSCTASMLTQRYSFVGEECEKHLFRHLILSERDIRDKSKADWVLKGIAVAQVAWLILSVIVRSIMHLPITQLEIATISFAAMAILSYAANWWKPKDISQATILETPAFGHTPKEQAYTQSLKLRLLSPTEAAESIKHIHDKLPRVPNDFVWMEGDSPLIFTIMAISSLGFGGLHCIACETVKQCRWWERLRKFCEKASPIITIVSGVIYTTARLVILVLLFTCLRETPAGVYQVTPWLNFLPNFS
ncbi:Major facilitator superfamily domain general substrate transporter protein [Colletotrichum asianum]